MKQEFKQSILDALANPNLTGALGNFSVAYRAGRAKARQKRSRNAAHAFIGHVGEETDDAERDDERETGTLVEDVG